MTGVLADGLWSASGKTSSKDSRDLQQQSSSSHMSAGLKGLTKGVFGGLTSMITEPLEGASKKGVGVRLFFIILSVIYSTPSLNFHGLPQQGSYGLFSEGAHD